MSRKLKLFLYGAFEAEVAPSGICKKKGDIVLSVRAKQVQKYKEINRVQIEERKKLRSQYQ